MGVPRRRLVLVGDHELAQIFSDPERLFDFSYDEAPAERRLDLGESWPALGKLPLDFLIAGVLIGVPEVGFGARGFNAGKVKQIAAAVAEPAHAALVPFLRRGAAEGLALLVWLD